MQIRAIYESVTQQIIRDLERGAPTWLKPWKRDKRIGIMPANAVTGRHYSGINIPILWAAADSAGYPTPAWLTFKQAQEKGATVRKGEKSTYVVFTKRVSAKDEDDGETRHYSMLKSFNVFNVAQIDGLPAPAALQETEPPEVHAFVKATGAEFRFGGDHAAFVPHLDLIVMPQPRQFESEESYHATCLHELVHFSGGKPRLNRDLSGRFGTRAYAAEELIAELGAAFLCAHLGIKGELRHAGYLANWLEFPSSVRRLSGGV